MKYYSFLRRNFTLIYEDIDEVFKVLFKRNMIEKLLDLKANFLSK